MAARSHLAPLIVITGQTGTGKTALAIQLAQKYGGEIIAADSRTVYKGMDIGTAKPTAEEQHAVRHYGLDVVRPDERFSAYDFKQLADAAIQESTARGKMPFLVGGTGLYIDAVLYDFAFRTPPDPAFRSALQAMSVSQLQQQVIAAGLPLPENATNPRHLQRLLEGGTAPTQPKLMRPHTLVLGLQLARDVLWPRIEARVTAMLAGGLVDEVRRLRAQYGNVEALRAPGYQAIGTYLDGELTLAEAHRAFVRSDMQLAKRQLTWFKRNPSIHWLTSGNKMHEAALLVNAFLNGDNDAF